MTEELAMLNRLRARQEELLVEYESATFIEERMKLMRELVWIRLALDFFDETSGR